MAMNSHFALPKIGTIGDEFTLSLAKNSQFLFLPSHFPSLPCGAEIRNEFTLSIAKIFFALFVTPLSNGTSRATSDQKPKTNDQILPSPIIGSAEALPILCVRYIRCERERYRERDESDVTIVALKLAMNLHVPVYQKFAQLAMSLHFPLPKTRTFVSPFTLPVSPFTERSPLWR